jgi:hypothetical protein
MNFNCFEVTHLRAACVRRRKGNGGETGEGNGCGSNNEKVWEKINLQTFLRELPFNW